MKRLLLTAMSTVLLSIGLAVGHPSAEAQHSHVQETKNILLVHGSFADGSSWAKVIPALQEKGYHVVAVQIPLTSFADDVAAVNRAIALADGPVLLVGHSYGGVVITEAGNNGKVSGLVYVAAYAINAGQSLLALSKSSPASPLGSEMRPDKAGFLTVTEKGINEDFAQDLPEKERQVLAATQVPASMKTFSGTVTQAAWKTKPSWYIVASSDRAISPNAEQAMAAQIGAHTTTVDSSHVVMLSHPDVVVSTIESAAHDEIHGARK